MTTHLTSARRIACILISCVAITLSAASPSHASTRIQHLISPGGIEAWFVQDATVPLIAMEYAFCGGASQDPVDKAGVGNMVADLLDEGSGDLDSKTFHERLDRRAIELSFNSTRDTFRGSLRMLKDNKDEAFDLLRMSLSSPISTTRCRTHSRPDHLRTAARHHSIRPRSPAANSSSSRSAITPMAGRPRARWKPFPTINVADLKDYVRRVLAKDTLKIAVVGDVDAATLGKLLDQTFGGLPAKASLVPMPDVDRCQTAATRVHPARRAANRDHVRRPRLDASRSEFHGRLCRQSHPRRCRVVVPALPRSSRKARPRLFGL